MSNKNKNDSNNDANKSSKTPSIKFSKGKDEGTDTKSTEDKITKEINPMFNFLRKFGINEFTNIILALFAVLLYCLTREQIDIARHSSRIELRAYLQADSVYFIKFRTNEEIIMGVRITNVGQTPAYNFRGIEKPKFRNQSFISDTMKNMFIGGNRAYLDLWMRSSKIIGATDSLAIFKGIDTLGYRGYFFYEDVFGDTDSFKVCNIFDTKSGKFVLCENYQEYYPPYK